jgi:hypothetical protein
MRILEFSFLYEKSRRVGLKAFATRIIATQKEADLEKGGDPNWSKRSLKAIC